MVLGSRCATLPQITDAAKGPNVSKPEGNNDFSSMTNSDFGQPSCEGLLEYSPLL